MASTVTRLYKQFQPSHYDLTLDIHDESLTFQGEVTIIGKKTGRPAKRITLHQKDLKIQHVKLVRVLKNGDHQAIAITRTNLHASYDELRIHTEAMLYPGEYHITISFTGIITRPMNGMYPCVFSHEGQDKQLIATQFESHHAREVFPCIDEPEAKATFDLTLTVPTNDNRQTIANTPIQRSVNTGGKTTHVFETSPRMSTYLLAFVTGDMRYLEAKTARGITVRTYATPDNVAYTQFALDCAVRMLDFYEAYFDIPYPLDKCDMIALPDFASGAMENWGCITYREQALLVDPDNTSLGSKQYVAMVVAHELAHQWFGNLVTMRWWTDLWLNEGFASWIEYLAVDHLFPEWHMWTQFIVDEQRIALNLDALEHTHAVEVPIKHPDEIRSIFDTISYSKGSSVIHMLQEYLGGHDFQKGLHYYLTQHAYKNTDTIDLWAALEHVSGKPVKNFMHAWTSQSGFPVVSVNVQDTTATIAQSRFFVNPSHAANDSNLWPIALLTNDPNQPDRLDSQSITTTISATKAFRINHGASGFYRVIYDRDHCARLGSEISQGGLTVVDRLALLNDLASAAKAGHGSTVDALQFMGHYAHETDYAVWDVMTTILAGIKTVMGTEVMRDAMKPYILALTHGEFKRLGFKTRASDTHFDQLLRPVIVGMVASADDPMTVAQCKALFAAQQPGQPITIDPDLRGVVFGTIARQGNNADFDKMAAMHNASKLSEERLVLCGAITGFKQPALIQRALTMITSNDVRLQDVSYWIAYSLMNRFARDDAWQWLQDNWTWLESNIGSDLSFARMPLYVARVQNDLTFTQAYAEFFTPRLTPVMDRSYKQGLETIQWQSAWNSRDYDATLAYFKQQASL